MSISPPSDIILDVARAADPVRYKEAAARLNRVGGGKGEESFEATMSALPEAATAARAGAGSRLPQPAGTDPTAPRGKAVAAGKPDSAKAYEGFEAMALATFIESMMPKDAEATFGTGNAGQIWKSMLAQQIAGEVARSGGLGIARQLAASAAADMALKPDPREKDASLAANLLVTTAERDFIGAVRPDKTGSDDDASA